MNTLSPDLLRHFAITYLDHKDIIALDRSCKHIHQRLCGSSVRDIWKDLFIRDFTKHLDDCTNFRLEYKWTTERYHAIPFDRHLEYACIDGYEVIVERCVNDLVLYWRSDLNKGLESACLEGHLDIVKMLIQAGVNPNFYYGSSLRLALQKGHTDITQYLIKKGALPSFNIKVSGIE